jgi:hypothetical protein
MKGVAAGDGDAEHPHRDHRREVERGDARADAERLAHRIDIDAGAGALGILALQHMRDAAGEFDHFEAALDVALGVGDHLAMFGAEQVRQLVHVLFDQRLEGEHHAGAALRVGRGPAGLGGLGGGDRLVEIGLGAERDPGLDLAGVRVEHLYRAGSGATGMADDDMVDVTHLALLPQALAARLAV